MLFITITCCLGHVVFNISEMNRGTCKATKRKKGLFKRNASCINPTAGGYELKPSKTRYCSLALSTHEPLDVTTTHYITTRLTSYLMLPSGIYRWILLFLNQQMASQLLMYSIKICNAS